MHSRENTDIPCERKGSNCTPQIGMGLESALLFCDGSPSKLILTHGGI